MKIIPTVAAAMLIGIVLALPARSQQVDEVSAVRQLIMQTFDKPETPLVVDPVTVLADVAVAGWAQGDMGGRALLRKRNGVWSLHLCSGDALKDAAALQQFGLPPEQARALAAAVAAAEAKLDQALVAKFSRFDGVVTMDSESQHPSVDADKSQEQ